MKTVTLTTETTQKVLDYLATRPFVEVSALITEVMNVVKAQQAAALKAAQTEVHNAISNGSDKTV